MEERLRRLEASVSQLEAQQAESLPYLHIAKDSHSLVKLQQILAGFKKQNNELEYEYQSNQQGLEDAKRKSEVANRHAKTWIEAELHRREETLLKVEYKLTQLERIFESIDKKSIVSTQGIEDKLRQDISIVIHNAREKCMNDKKFVKESLDQAASVTNKEMDLIHMTQQHTEEILDEFESKYSGIIKSSGSSKERAKGKGDLRLAVIDELSERIQKSVDECKRKLDKEFKIIARKFNAEMKRIRTQLEILKRQS